MQCFILNDFDFGFQNNLTINTNNLNYDEDTVKKNSQNKFKKSRHSEKACLGSYFIFSITIQYSINDNFYDANENYQFYLIPILIDCLNV